MKEHEVVLKVDDQVVTKAVGGTGYVEYGFVRDTKDDGKQALVKFSGREPEWFAREDLTFCMRELRPLSERIRADVIPSRYAPDVAMVTYEGVRVSVSRAESGKYTINLERISDGRADVEVMDDGGEPLWEGNLA